MNCIAIETDFTHWKSGGVKYEHELLNALEIIGLKKIKYRSKNLLSRIKIAFELLFLVHRIKPKLVYIDSAYFYLFFIFKFFPGNVNIITSYQADISVFNFVLVKYIKKYILKLFLSRCNLVIANSELTALELTIKYKILESNIFTAYPCIDKEFVTERNIKPSLPVNVMLFSGADKRKGLLIFLESTNLLDINKFHFYIVISDEELLKIYGSNIFNQVKSLPITLLPRLSKSDLIKFYENIHCVCLPSIYETFGIAALESIGMKKYTLVSDVFSQKIRNLISQKFIFKSESPGGLAQSLSEVYDRIYMYKEDYLPDVPHEFIGWSHFQTNVINFLKIKYEL